MHEPTRFELRDEAGTSPVDPPASMAERLYRNQRGILLAMALTVAAGAVLLLRLDG